MKSVTSLYFKQLSLYISGKNFPFQTDTCDVTWIIADRVSEGWKYWTDGSTIFKLWSKVCF